MAASDRHGRGFAARSGELRPALNRAALHCLVALGAAVAPGTPAVQIPGYAPGIPVVADDTLRLKTTEIAARARRSSLAWGAVIRGYFSARGLPPVQGQFTVTDTGLVFHSAEGYAAIFPLVGALRSNGGGHWRPSTVSLAYVVEADGRSVYLFRIDAGVFETDDPGPLLEVAAHPAWLDSLESTEWASERPLVNAADSTALWKTARAIAAGSYADSLYALFGQPRASVGLIGRRGRIAGRLGEYIASRDSLALDPARMTGQPQLRHTLAHELGHRWQMRAKNRLGMLWSGVPPIRDPKRYGYGNRSEQQAEAIAFAINFLQTTASTAETSASSLSLLDHYELLVPGTQTMARYLLLQPLYRHHPLRSLLTTGGPL
jgi:hypothetical protein